MAKSKTPNNIPFKNVSKGTSSTQADVDRLELFLEKYLPFFTKEREIEKGESENVVTEKLYTFLQRKRKFNDEKIEYPFEFQTENIQKVKKGHDKRIDIGTYLNTANIDMEFFYCIEAKILPTGKGREKEYVNGKGGAIERFKREEHGKDNRGNLLKNNAIVAYIKQNDFPYWQNVINT